MCKAGVVPCPDGWSVCWEQNTNWTEQNHELMVRQTMKDPFFTGLVNLVRFLLKENLWLFDDENLKVGLDCSRMAWPIINPKGSVL